MALLFKYQPIATRHPVLTLGGRFFRSYPLITVTLIGPGGTVLIKSLLDPGADDTVFPENTAQQLGIDLSNAPTGSASGVGLGAASLSFAEVTLRIATNAELREWHAMVGFTATPLRRSLLGIAGFLQFFTATFRGDKEEVELEVNSLYPGT